MVEAKSLSIPNFVRASSPQGLRRSMLMNNARLGAFVVYHSIQAVSEKGKIVWYAWFFEELKNNDEILTKDGE